MKLDWAKYPEIILIVFGKIINTNFKKNRLNEQDLIRRVRINDKMQFVIFYQSFFSLIPFLVRTNLEIVLVDKLFVLDFQVMKTFRYSFNLGKTKPSFFLTFERKQFNFA